MSPEQMSIRTKLAQIGDHAVINTNPWSNWPYQLINVKSGWVLGWFVDRFLAEACLKYLENEEPFEETLP
jgi:hypothetical protein